MVDVADLVNEAAPEGEVMDGCNSFCPLDFDMKCPYLSTTTILQNSLIGVK